MLKRSFPWKNSLFLEWWFHCLVGKRTESRYLLRHLQTLVLLHPTSPCYFLMVFTSPRQTSMWKESAAQSLGFIPSPTNIHPDSVCLRLWSKWCRPLQQVNKLVFTWSDITLLSKSVRDIGVWKGIEDLTNSYKHYTKDYKLTKIELNDQL